MRKIIMIILKCVCVCIECKKIRHQLQTITHETWRRNNNAKLLAIHFFTIIIFYTAKLLVNSIKNDMASNE